MSAGDQALGRGAIPIEPLGLEVRPEGAADSGPFVPVEAKPPHPLENPFDHLGRGALHVGILDAEHEDAAVPAREQPVEQRRAGAADMQVPGG